MRIYEKRYVENIEGYWIYYYIFGKLVYTKCVCLYWYM